MSRIKRSDLNQTVPYLCGRNCGRFLNKLIYLFYGAHNVKAKIDLSCGNCMSDAEKNEIYTIVDSYINRAGV